MRRALVLGAGGHGAIAWEVGIVAGAADGGVPLADADLFVGTSAGSIVAAQIANGVPPGDAFDRQVDPQQQTSEPTPAFDLQRWRLEYARAKAAGGSATDILKRIGAMALAAKTIAESERRAIIARRLPIHTWPARPTIIVAVDAESGERRAFDSSSGVDLVDAVAASAAVPGIWPAVTIQGRRYIDGGVYSLDNAELAAGCDRVVVVALRPRSPSVAVAPFESALAELRAAGAAVEVIHPDDRTEAAFAVVGGNLLDPRVRSAAALAGREQGRELAAHLARFWD